MAFKLLGKLSAAGVGATGLILAWKFGGGSSQDVQQSGKQATTSYCKEPPKQSSSETLEAGPPLNLKGSTATQEHSKEVLRFSGAKPRLGEKKGAELDKVVGKCRVLVRRVMREEGVPGGVVAVAKDGKLLWSEGMGLADVENDTPCTTEAVMRIASISKPLAAVGLLQLYEQGKVDLDAPIQTYVPEFPRKQFEGEEVEVTVRGLLSHLAGIRHYHLKKEGVSEFQSDEYLLKSHYKTVSDALQLFLNDDLVCKPGSKFHYTTHGWTLLSRVIEVVSGKTYTEYVRDNVVLPLGMTHTAPEMNRKIVYGRARHYVRNNGVLKNAPYVDLSYKWAGGGYLSNAEDLVKFGSAVLTSFQLGSLSQEGLKPEGHTTNDSRCVLHPNTTAMMLTPAVSALRDHSPSHAPPVGYGMGWFIRQGKEGFYGGREYPFVFSHTGGAVGACSVLTVMADNREKVTEGSGKGCGTMGVASPPPLPQGVVVAVIFNLQGVKTSMFQLGLQIAEEFYKL